MATARDEAIAALQYVLGAAQAGSDLSAIDVAPVVDNIIEAAREARLSEHAQAVEGLRRNGTAKELRLKDGSDSGTQGGPHGGRRQ